MPSLPLSPVLGGLYPASIWSRGLFNPCRFVEASLPAEAAVAERAGRGEHKQRQEEKVSACSQPPATHPSCFYWPPLKHLQLGWVVEALGLHSPSSTFRQPSKRSVNIPLSLKCFEKSSFSFFPLWFPHEHFLSHPDPRSDLLGLHCSR